MDRITEVENGQIIFPENSTGSQGGKNTCSNVLKDSSSRKRYEHQLENSSTKYERDF